MKSLILHSVTDLITNSSTTIFTYSDSCEKAVRTMFDEILKTFGIDKKFDEMFKTVVLCDYEDTYMDWVERYKDGVFPDKNLTFDNFSEFFEDVKQGKVEKPEWFNEVEETEDRYDYFRPTTKMYIIPKDKRYEKISEYIIDFLYSTDHEATRDG